MTTFLADVRRRRFRRAQERRVQRTVRVQTLEAKGVLSELEEALTAYHFFRCNKCYLVNLEHVNGVNENCADVDGDQIQVSRPKKKAFLDTLNNYINEVGK